MVNTIRGASTKPVSSQQLADFFENNPQYEGHLYLGYPIIATPEGPYPIDALWVSPEKGVVIFNLVEGTDLDDYEQLQDDSANKLGGKFRAHRDLMNGRNLAIALNVVTFAPTIPNAGEIGHEDYAICNEEGLTDWIDLIEWVDNSAYLSLVSVIQSISSIRNPRKRKYLKEISSRGAKLKNLEESIANLDSRQSQAVIETVDGVQRIRGLAGSGKTIVLALKAAYLHALHPDWKVAVTFHTRSLKHQFRRLINVFVIEQTGEAPDWKKLQIIHAWGAPGNDSRNGVYYSFCQNNGTDFFDFKTAREKFGRGREFEGACEAALTAQVKPVPLFDVILVDEAQDLSPAFLRLCYESLGDEKRLVYAYDELQSLNNKSLPPPDEIFGKAADGSPNVHFHASQAKKTKQDIILKKCYRNSRPVLATAHALGFGIYREPSRNTGTGLIQMFDQKNLWCDVGYEVEDGNLDEGQCVTLARSADSSPVFLENHSEVEDLIQFHCFNNKDEQATWLAREISINLDEDELQYDDIIVINPDPLTTRGEVGVIRSILFDQKINSHLAGVDTSPDVFFESNSESITFTGIFRAKGNEAGMVYIINAQDCYSSFESLATIRNRLFTAMTRSKAWVRVLGVGEPMQNLIREFDLVKDKDFKLQFRYPTEEQRKKLNIVNRDLTPEEQKSAKMRAKGIESLIADLEEERVLIEELDEKQISKLRNLLGRG